MSKDNLLPCPFCGSPDVVVAYTRIDSETFWYDTECRLCGCQMPPRDAKADAIAAWNTRAVGPGAWVPAEQHVAAQKEIERLRAAGEKLADAAYHGEECPMNTSGAYCNCGYEEAAIAWTLARAAPQESKP